MFIKPHNLLLSCLTVLLFACNNNTDQQATNTDTLHTITHPLAKFNIMPVDVAEIPPSLTFKGTVYQAWQWEDSLGNNLLITSQEPPVTTKNADGEDGATASLHAFHYVKKTGDYKLLWQMHDSMTDCPLDIACHYIDSVQLTDLNNNGILETSLLYKIACRGDVSPAYMKLIMHEDSVKYALRGNMWVQQNSTDSFTVTANNVNLETLPKAVSEYGRLVQLDGRYESEKDFKQAPPAFLPFAQQLWLKHVIEKFDQD